MSWVLFDAFKADVANGVHNLGSDTLKIMLTNTAPSKANDGQKSEITEIAAGNGYTAGGTAATVSTSTQTSGTYSLVIDTVTFTAAGGSIADWRYAVLYNDTAATDELIACYDYGETYTITDGSSFPFLTNSNGVIQLA